MFWKSERSISNLSGNVSTWASKGNAKRCFVFPESKGNSQHPHLICKFCCVQRYELCTELQVEIELLLLQFLTKGAGIAQWYSAELRGGWSGVRVPAGAGNFSPHQRVQTDSEIHPVSYTMGTGGSFPGAKAAGAWRCHLHLVPRSRMSAAIPPLPNTPSWCGAQLKHGMPHKHSLLQKP
jgi:hypothetical protein